MMHLNVVTRQNPAVKFDFTLLEIEIKNQPGLCTANHSGNCISIQSSMKQVHLPASISQDSQRMASKPAEILIMSIWTLQTHLKNTKIKKRKEK